MAGGPYLALASVPEALDANVKPGLTMADQKELEKLRAQDQREIKALIKELQYKEKAMAEIAALLVLRKKWEGLLLEGCGRLTSASHRRKVVELISEANDAGAGLVSACREIGICLRTLKRWRAAFGGDGDGMDPP